MQIVRVGMRMIDRVLQMAPGWALVFVTAFVLGSQIVRPHHRMVKALVMLIALVIIMRFNMVYSLYLFTFLFLFPSGILITSTNVLLITLLLLLWTVRAASMRRRLFDKTDADVAIALFLLANVLCFWNVDNGVALAEGLKLLWRQLTAVVFFYMIVTFVTDEKKLEWMIRVICMGAGFLTLTAVLELVAPGVTIIPGWISTTKELGQGTLGYRLEGLRLGGSLGFHGLLSDYCTITLFFMALLIGRARNPIERLLWVLVFLATFAVLLGTANRGAFFAFVIGLVYGLYVFRRRFGMVRMVLTVGTFIIIFGVAEYVLREYTVAASIVERSLATRFEGMVPDSRYGAWEPPFYASFDHIFIGHGLYYRIDPGLGRIMWPHNAYIYYLYTLGVIGVGTFLAVVYKVARTSLMFRLPGVATTFAGTVMSVLHVQLLVHLLEQMRTDHQRNSDYVYMYIVWMLFGLIMATGKIIKASQRRVENSPG